MSEVKLGFKLNPEATHHRDAIHVAVAPVVASHRLQPGELIGLNSAGFAEGSLKPIGIVDPFLKSDVRAGEMFWMVMMPGTTTTVRHEWTHPSFKPSVPEQHSVKTSPC